MPKKDAAKLDKLQQKMAKLQEQAEADESADQDALYDQIESVQEQIETIESKQTGTFHPDTKAHCGAIVTIGDNGEPHIVYGLMSKEDAAQLAKNETPAEEEAPSDESTTDQPQAAYSATLVESLTAVKTASIAAELSQQPNVTLRTVRGSVRRRTAGPFHRPCEARPNERHQHGVLRSRRSRGRPFAADHPHRRERRRQKCEGVLPLMELEDGVHWRIDKDTLHKRRHKCHAVRNEKNVTRKGGALHLIKRIQRSNSI